MAKKIKISKILTFPDARQATNFSCGAASLQAVLYYYGIDIREDKIVNALDVKPTSIIHSGVNPDVLKSKIEEIWKLKTIMRQMTIEDLKKFIDRDIPVIIPMQAWQDEAETKGKIDYSTTYFDGHYIVAIGYTDKYMIFEDPSLLGNHGYLSYDELNERWHDKDFNGNSYDHLGIAVYGKKPVYRAEVIKKIL